MVRTEDLTRLETAAVVALLRAARRPPAHYSDLIEERGSALAVLEEEAALLAPDKIGEAASEVVVWTEQGLELLTVLDPAYPANLRAVHDRPPLLFVAGRLRPGDERAVAVIGSRRPSPNGLAQARAIAGELVRSGYTIVSGLAAGIDTAAHTTALEHGAPTVAVLGTGLNRCYPPQNASLQRRIASQDAVISQFWPDDGPSRVSFPARNAVMSGLSLATVIVEASHRSGARIQARQALAHGRPVLLASPLLEQPWAQELARRPGTQVFRSPAEIPALVERLSTVDAPVA